MDGHGRCSPGMGDAPEKAGEGRRRFIYSHLGAEWHLQRARPGIRHPAGGEAFAE